jgi:signal transduction histidine kinase
VKASDSTLSPSGGLSLPLPDRQFKRFLAVFHTVFIGGILFCLFLRWRQSNHLWDWRDPALSGLVFVQIGLYTAYFIRPVRPVIRLGWWIGYAAASWAIWVAEWHLEPRLEWTIWAILGQLFGALPPKASLPLSGFIFASYFGFKIGWSRVASLSPLDWLAGSALVVAWSAVGLFIHKLTVTSADRARLIQELERVQRELERARDREIELATLKERERLARDLHDSLGHSLVTLTVQLEAAQRLYLVDPARASAVVDEMKRLTRTSMEQLRRALAGLRAPGLSERPLAPALRELCTEVGHRTGLKIDCQLPDQLDRLPPAVAEVLWRAAQEGLANIEKHAAAQTVRLSLQLAASDPPPPAETARPNSRRIILRVADDGIGLPPEAEDKPGHYGLRGLRERIEGVGGQFAISRTSPAGTRLEARIPLVE